MKLKKEMKSNSRIVNEDEIIFKDFSVHGANQLFSCSCFAETRRRFELATKTRLNVYMDRKRLIEQFHKERISI